MECGRIVLKRLCRDESGISLAEVMVAGAMASIIATAFLVVFSSFSRSVSLEESRAAALGEVQEAAANLAAELRQAAPAVDDGSPAVVLLDSDWATAELVFFSDRDANAAGPERYRYYVDACTASHCDLMRELTVADAAGPPWTFTGTPNVRRVISNLLISSDALFQGAEWSTGAEVVTTTCDATSPCSFSLVQITLRVDPDPNISAEAPVHVRHEVRMRNAN